MFLASESHMSLHQIEIYSQEYQFVVDLTKLLNYALYFSNFFDFDLLSHEPSIHASILSTLDS